MFKKIDYLGHLVEFCSHADYAKHQMELTKQKVEIENKWLYRVNGGEWKNGGVTLYDFTGFLYSKKTPEDLLNSYNSQND